MLNPDTEKIMRVAAAGAMTVASTGVLLASAAHANGSYKENSISPIVRRLGNYPSTRSLDFLDLGSKAGLFRIASQEVSVNPEGIYDNYIVRSSIDSWTPGEERPHQLNHPAKEGDFLYPSFSLGQKGEPVDHNLTGVIVKTRARAEGSVLIKACSVFGDQCSEGTDLSTEWSMNVTFPHAGIYYSLPSFAYVLVKDGSGNLYFDLELDAMDGQLLYSRIIRVTIEPVVEEAVPVRVYLPLILNK